jgi:glycerophosphoryl diester phosphodiesterase
MKGKLHLQRALKSALDKKENVTDTIPGLLGTIKNGKQRVKVTNRKGFVYVRLHGKLSETVQAYNDQVLQLYDMPVLVKRVHGKGYHYYVVVKDIGRYPNWGGNNAQAQYAQHGNQHSFGIGAGGSDVVWVFKKQFMPLLLYPYSGTAVRVADDWYQWGDVYKHFTGSTVELGSAKPSIVGDSRFVTLYLDGNTNTVKGTTGTLFTSTPFPADVSPYINVPTPSEGIPLSAVLLTSDTINIAWNNIYDDIRPIFGIGGGESAIYVSGTISNLTSQYVFYLTDNAASAPIPTGSYYSPRTMLVADYDEEVGLEVSSYMYNTYQTIPPFGYTFWAFVDEQKADGYLPAGVWGASIVIEGNRATETDLAWLEFRIDLFKQTAAGVETLISSSNSLEEKVGKARYEFTGEISSAVTLESTSRLIIRIKAQNAYSGVDTRLSHVWLYVNGEANSIVILPIAPSHGGGHIFADEGVNLNQRGYANFVGAGVTASDDATNGQTIISIPGTISFDDGVFRVSGTILSFDVGLHVDVTGSVAYIQSINPTISDLNTHEPFIVIAHRGDINNTDGYPEDTVAAVLSAYWRGAHRSEIDVRQSADGTWYAIHDDTVNRTTNGAGNVVDKTDAELDALWIDGGYGYNASRHSGTYHPPTLQAIITALDPLDTTLQIENKTASNSRSIAELLVANNWQHRALIQVQSQAEAQAVNAVSPTIKVISHSSVVWSETDTISAATGTYTETQIAAYAPKQVIIYDSIDNYTGSNQATLIRDAWDIGARGFNTWDLNVAFYEYQKFRYLDDHIADPNAHPGLVGGGGSSITIYEGGTQKATGTTGIDFHAGFGVIVSGTVAYITNSIVSGTSTYVRAGAPEALTAITGAYWAVPDHVYATGTLSLFINGVAQSPVIDFTEQYPASGTYQLTSVHPTGTIFTAIWGVPIINTLNSPPYDARFVMGEANAGVPNGVVKDYLYDNYDRDAYPTSPTSWDDDFDSTSINAKWKQINNPSSPNSFSTSKYPGYLWVGLVENVAGQDIFQAQPRIYQPAPTGIDATGTFSFIAKAALSMDGQPMEVAEYSDIQVYLGTSGTFEFVGSIIEFNDSVSVNQSARCIGSVNSATGSMAGMTTTQWQIVDPTDFVYLKLSKITSGSYTATNTYKAYFSKNGMTWQEVGTQSKAFTGIPNEVGLLFRRPKLQSGTAYTEALVDFFRKV